MAKLVKKMVTPNNISISKVDAEIERVVAKLYGFGKKDYKIIFKAIKESEDLLPVRALKKITASDIF